jgi:L-histidine Nalpha-methyltransferase
VEFEAGEEILTEISCKFRPDRLADELAEAGFRTVESWVDPGGDFLVSLAQPA